jgi:hypothetical protein
MSTHEATVEVLTAEVRVLMVGSRQVTLSVYSQLDSVDDVLIEPFGRVRPRNADAEYVYLIGKRSASGELVRASIPVAEASICRHAHLGELVYQRYEHLRKQGWNEKEAERRERQLTPVGYMPPEFAEKTRACREEAAEHERQAALLLEQYEELAEPCRERAREVANLPLIVLAGLR